MKALLDALCDRFDEELERQENVLAVCKAQGAAARVHDLEYLEAKTAALNALMQEFVDAEPGRVRLIEEVRRELDLTPDCDNLTGLIPVLPEPWRTRAREFQHRIRETLLETRQAVMENDSIIRRSMNVVDEALEALVRCVPADPPGYDAQGSEKPGAAVAATFLDQRG